MEQRNLQLTQVLKQCAHQIFSRHSGRKFREKLCNGWFDEECKLARLSMMEKGSQMEVMLLYKNLVKRKKRKFLRRKSLALSSKFQKNPKTFWAYLRTRSSPPDLDISTLMAYVEKIYHFHEAHSMPLSIGPTFSFSIKKAESQLKKLAKGKSLDLEWLSVELLIWGGDSLLPILTHFLNDAMVYGSPKSWLVCKVVPIHKVGKKMTS